MSQARKIKLIKGNLVLSNGAQVLPGQTADVSEELFKWLKSKESNILKFEEVGSEDETPEDLNDGIPEDDDLPVGGDGDDLPSEDDLPGDEDSEDETPDTGETSGGNAKNSDLISLSAVDSTLAGKLVAAGFDTLDKLRAASDAELLAVNGVGTKRLAQIREDLES